MLVAMRVRASLPLVLAALSIASAASAAPSEAPPSHECASVGPGDRSVRVAWDTAERTAGCFFFSGPADLGRDDHLGASARLTWNGEDVTLAFGALRFTGRADASGVHLSRRSDHQYGGRWVVTEHIDGRLERGDDGCTILRATYRYREGMEGSQPGHCTIRAALAVTAL